MSVKIFMPLKLFYAKENCDIYGEIHINGNNSVSYFIINALSSRNTKESTKFSCTELRHLGHITGVSDFTKLNKDTRDVALSFCYDEDTPNIYINNLSIKSPDTKNANVFLYDEEKIKQLYCDMVHRENHLNNGKRKESFDVEQYDDMHMLYYIIERSYKFQRKRLTPKAHSLIEFLRFALILPLETINKLFQILIEYKLIVFLIKKTVFYEHYLDWKKYLKSGKRNHNITLDRMLGVCVMFILLFYVSHPGDYLIQASQIVIKELRLLLHSLKGSPIGLKLNVHLNNFFLDCFSYHIDLWATFLSKKNRISKILIAIRHLLGIIEPAVRQLFVPIALFGAMGLSYQLAMLSDLIAVIGLHAHCFYIYTAVLYKVEIKGLQVLWKVVLGKRRNLLKNRVESHNYMNRQLYLATIFFTTLLFLFPTILIYYVVFTTLRLCIYLVNLVLKVKRHRILEFPLDILLKWISGNFYEINSLHLQHREHVPSPLLQSVNLPMRMSIYVINVKSSSLSRVFSCESGVLKELSTHEQTSLSNIVQRILEGKF